MYYMNSDFSTQRCEDHWESNLFLSHMSMISLDMGLNLVEGNLKGKIKPNLIYRKERINMLLVIWHPTPVLLPGKSHGRRSLVDCSPWGPWGSDTTERLHFHFSLSSIGEGNGNPLQCSCLENPRDGGAWWAAVSGVAQSQTWLKRLSSSRMHTALFRRGKAKKEKV